MFEEELETSKLRKGGANPVVGIDNNGISHVEFKFFSNHHPLRFVSTGNCSFIAIHVDTPFMKPIKPMTCPKQHVLKEEISRLKCSICSSGESTGWSCEIATSGSIGASLPFGGHPPSTGRALPLGLSMPHQPILGLPFGSFARKPCLSVCKKCYNSDRATKEAERRNPAKHPTFLRCLVSCSFSLQLPVSGRADPTTGSFCLSMEVRLTALPLPAKPLQSLLHFSGAEVSRSFERASAYLTSDGLVVADPKAHLERVQTEESVSFKISKKKLRSLIVELKKKEMTLTGSMLIEKSNKGKTSEPEEMLRGGASQQRETSFGSGMGRPQIQSASPFASPFGSGMGLGFGMGQPQIQRASAFGSGMGLGSGMGQPQIQRASAFGSGSVQHTLGQPEVSDSLELNEKQKEKLRSEIDAIKKEIESLSETTRNFVDDGLPFVRKGVWTIISFNVFPVEGRMATYINGRKCHEANGINPADLQLQHKLVVFGGGKLAHSQGGDIRRLIVQGAGYTDSKVYDEVLRMMASSSLFIEYISKIQAHVRGYIQRLKYVRSCNLARTRTTSSDLPSLGSNPPEQSSFPDSRSASTSSTNTGGSVSSSSSSSFYGTTKEGTVCKKCIKKGSRCRQHLT